MSTSKRKKKTAREKKRIRARTQTKSYGLTASQADPLKLYEASVQNNQIIIDLIDRMFEREGRKQSMTLREDFCGTAKLCSDWVRSDPHRTAIGIDIDKSTLEWAMRNNIDSLSGAAERVKLVEQDVLSPVAGNFDTIVAFNFSYWVFQKREILKSYFSAVLNSLEPGGVFIVDLHGGPDSQFILEEETQQDDFIYVWEQESFDPINNRVKCHIHFRFADGTELNRAFSYDWRIWTLPELRELLEEAGFSHVDTWWDDEDDVIRLRQSADNLISWIAYLAAWR